MRKIQQLNRRLRACCVFRKICATPLLQAFFAYAEADETHALNEKIQCYGQFVSLIYDGGGNLCQCVRRALLEDENVYVHAVAEERELPAYLEQAVFTELETLSMFASLTPDDFFDELGRLEFLPGFATGQADLAEEYRQRMQKLTWCGYGIYAFHGMFSVQETGTLQPIASADPISLDHFVGYEEERRRVQENTEAFLAGRPAANVLLYGDAGTGKSSTVKALVNHYFEQGLRLIEIRKDQIRLLPRIMGMIRKNPLKFILFIDDLSFQDIDESFNLLKAILEGSASVRSANAVIYATSNRRHLVRETGADCLPDLHRNDAVQETLSLSERFGLTVLFEKPSRTLYLTIVSEMARRNGLTVEPAELERAAEEFALRRGYRSARCAEQFIRSLM